MKFKVVFGCIFIFIFQPLRAQEKKTPQQIVEEMVESLAENTDTELDFTSITDELLYLTENPLNLNTAEVDDFEKLPFLTQFQIMSLLSYRDRSGEIYTMYELMLVSGFNETTLRLMVPFVTILPMDDIQTIDIRKVVSYSRNELIARVSGTIEKPDGYHSVSDSILSENPNDYYPGNRLRYYSKYKFTFKEQIEAGFTAEKDAGEQFFNGTQPKGFDFYSGHLQLNDIGFFRTVVLGDFEALFGQGLVMGSYLSNSKSALVMDVRKKFKGLKKYSSTDENQFFRGAGTTLKLKNVSISAFASYKPLDANLEEDSTQIDGVVVTALQNSGIHATPAQLVDKHSLHETVIGGNFQWKMQNIRFGFSGISSSYSQPLAVSNQPEDRFLFTGVQNHNIGTDFLWAFRSLYLFGEAALSKNKGKAALVGALFELSPQVSLSVLYRNYGVDYQTHYGNAFSESGKNQNERGFYSGIQLLPFKKWKFSAYYDFYRFPMLTSKADGPSQGYDYFIQADFTVNRNLNMYFKLKNEIHEINATGSTPAIAHLTQQQQWQYRYQISYSLNNQWQFKNRIEVTQYKLPDEKPEKGFLMYQDINFDAQNLPFSVTFRYALYQTDSYNSRIYAYENDVLHAFSVPALYDKGSRVYLLINYRVSEKAECWFRISQTAFAQKDEIGSGMDRIAGNHKTEVKVQLRWKF